MLNTANTTIICPLNDAESFTIIKIAKRLGFETRVSLQNSWFCPLNREPNATFHESKENLIIVEMPGPENEAILSKKHRLFIVDHHHYASLGLNRDNPKSSIEQFAKLIGYTLSREELGIAINDQKYIYGLVEAGYSQEEIKEIRKLDLSLQGFSSEDFQLSEADFHSQEQLGNDLYIYKSSTIEKFSYLLDLHVLSKNCQFSNVIILGKANEQKGDYIYFSGKMEIINILKDLGGFSKQSSEQYGLWGGFERGVEQVDIMRALEIIKSVQ